MNPKDILVVYENDYGKCRTCAFTIVGVLDKDAEWADDKEIQNVISEATMYQVKNLNNLVAANQEIDVEEQPLFQDVNSITIEGLSSFSKMKDLLDTFL